MEKENQVCGTGGDPIKQEPKNDGANSETSSNRRSGSPLNLQYLWEEQQVSITQHKEVGLARPMAQGETDGEQDTPMASLEEMFRLNNSQLLLRLQGSDTGI